MLLYAITALSQLPADSAPPRPTAPLLRLVRHWAASGVDYIQLREKQLPPPELRSLAVEILSVLRATGSPARLLLNGPPQIAVSVGAGGVHLPSGSGQPAPSEVRSLYHAAGLPAPIVSVSCHTLDDILTARRQHADLALFAPVFEKPLPGQTPLPGQGIESLRAAAAAAAPMPVLALGGITLCNAPQCLAAGASGLASIRLFLPSANGALPDLTPLLELRTLKSDRPG